MPLLALQSNPLPATQTGPDAPQVEGAVPDGSTVFVYYFDMAGDPDVALDFGGATQCNATLGGGVTERRPMWTSVCRQGRCLYFDGQDDVVVTDCDAQPASSFTLRLTFFPRTLWLEPGQTAATPYTVSDSDLWTLVSGPDLKVQLMPGERILIVKRAGEECTTDPVVRPNDWNDLTVTYDDLARTLHIFLDGRLVTECSFSSSSNLPPAQVEIGDDSALQDDAFHGMIDHMELWAETMAAGGPIFRFGFEHVAQGESRAWDDSPNNNHADEAMGADILIDEASVYGHAASFDGNTFLVIPHQVQGDPDCPSFVSHPEAMDIDRQWRESGGLTMETWVLFRSAPSGPQTFLHRATQDGKDDYWWLGVTDGYLVARLGGDSGEIRAAWQPEKYRWYHVAAAYSRGHVWLYVNGRLVADAPVEPLLSPTSQPACIGARCWEDASGLHSRDHLADASLDNVQVTAGTKTRFDVFEARYDFEEESGGVVPDRSANRHDLSLSSNASLSGSSDGWDLRALQLSGGYGHIQGLSDAVDEDGNLGSGLSVDAWVRYDDTIPEGEHYTILSITRIHYVWLWWGQYVPFYKEEVWFGLGGISSPDAASLTFTYRDATISKRLPIAPGTWHHVGASWDGRNLHLFLDGRQVAFAPAVQTDDSYASLEFGGANIGARIVGMVGIAEPSDYFGGSIDEFRLSRFPKDLTEDPDGDRMDDSHELIRSTVRTEDYPQANPNKVNRRMAMLVNGGEERYSDLARAFEYAALSSMYLLRAVGYHNQDVTSYEPLWPDPGWDYVDRCPVDMDYWDPSGPDPHSAILQKLDSFAPSGSQPLGPRDTLLFNFADHGHLSSPDGCSICQGWYQLLRSLHSIEDHELGDKAASLNTYRTIFLMASCFAGVAIDDTAPAGNVIFIAATAPAKGNSWPWLETFQKGLFAWGERTGDGMISYEEAFAYTWDVAGQFGTQGDPNDATGLEDERLNDDSDLIGHNPWFYPQEYDPDQEGMDGYLARRCWP